LGRFFSSLKPPEKFAMQKMPGAEMSGWEAVNITRARLPRQILSNKPAGQIFSLTPSLSHPMGEGVRQDG